MRTLIVLGLLAAVASGCAVDTTGPASDDTEADIIKSSASLTLAVASDPGLRIAMSLVHRFDATIGAENVAVVLTRGTKNVTVACSELTKDDAGGDSLNCQLSRGRDAEDVHEEFFMQINHDVSGGSDVYTLTRAEHQQEGTRWVPAIEALFPAWKTGTFKPERLTVVSKGDASKDPFVLAANLRSLFTSATANLMVPNQAARINAPAGVKAPSGGPFKPLDGSCALWGDYSMTFGFQIAKEVWWQSSDPVSPFVTPGDATSGLVSATELRSRLDVVIGK